MTVNYAFLSYLIHCPLSYFIGVMGGIIACWFLPDIYYNEPKFRIIERNSGKFEIQRKRKLFEKWHYLDANSYADYDSALSQIKEGIEGLRKIRHEMKIKKIYRVPRYYNNIIEKGYRPTNKLDTSKPPSGRSVT